MTQENVAITGEPITDAMCRFSVDRPVYPEKSFYFGSKEQAEGSILAERLFAIDGVRGVQISHNQVTVRKTGMDEWPVIGKQVGSAIRAFLSSGEPAVSDEVRQRILPADEIRERVQQVLDAKINPEVAQHGGENHPTNQQVHLLSGDSPANDCTGDKSQQQGAQNDPQNRSSASLNRNTADDCYGDRT